MRKLLLAATALTVSSPVFAADLPVPIPLKAAPAPIPFTWTGCYVGGNLGAGWASTNASNSPGIAPAGASVGVNSTGFLGGGQVGCNLQVAQSWVLGAEADFSWASNNASTVDPFFTGKNGTPENLGVRTDWLTSATGRVGYTFDRWMIYGKGGAAWVRDDYSFSGFTVGMIPFNLAGSETRLGWTAGGGVEWAFAPAWSVRAEFDYYGFGPHTVSMTDQFGTITPTIKQNIEAVKFGINYRFWGGAT